MLGRTTPCPTGVQWPSKRSRSTSHLLKQSGPSMPGGPTANASVGTGSSGAWRTRSPSAISTRSGQCSRPGSATRSATAAGSRLSRAGAAVTSVAPLPNVSNIGLQVPDKQVFRQLQHMGFVEAHIHAAARKVGNNRIEDLLEELVSTQPPSTILSIANDIEPLSPYSDSSVSSRKSEGTLEDELEQMGIAPSVIAATLSRLCPGACVADAVGALCQEPSSPLAAPDESWECEICFESQQTYGWQCPDGHRFCTTCMRQHIKAVAAPRCPQPKCSFELNAADLRLLKVSRKRIEAFEKTKLQSAIETLGCNSRSGTRGDKVVHCRREGCENVMLLPQGQCRERFACPCGAPPFCAQCGDSPYHFHADCAQVPYLRRRWLSWVSEARSSRKKQAEALLALQKRVEEDKNFKDDEIWKTKHCRLCPSCGRVVEKLEGCNSMKCGQDFHGGGKQAGCGATFDWDKAPAYIPGQSKLTKLIKPELEAMKGVVHPGIQCKVCRQEVFGARLRCIHCEDFDVCAGCEEGLDNHDLSHVFEVLYKADYDWSRHVLPAGVTVRIIRNGTSVPPLWHGNQFEGKVGDVVDIVKNSQSALQCESGSVVYKVKIRGHRGSDPEIPAEHVVPLFMTRWQARCLIEGRWGAPEPQPVMNHDSFFNLVASEGALVACRLLMGRGGC